MKPSEDDEWSTGPKDEQRARLVPMLLGGLVITIPGLLIFHHLTETTLADSIPNCPGDGITAYAHPVGSDEPLDVVKAFQRNGWHSIEVRQDAFGGVYVTGACDT